MGVAFGIIYLPILLACWVIASICIYKWDPKGRMENLSKPHGFLARLFGAVTATAVILLLVSLVVGIGGDTNTTFLLSVPVTLIGPFVISYSLLRYRNSVFDKYPSNIKTSVLNHMGEGSLHSIWIIPLSILGYLILR